MKYCPLLLFFLMVTVCGFGQNGNASVRGNASLPTSVEDLKKIMQYEKGTFEYTVEDFFQRPKQSSFQLSPDGKYFSYAEKDSTGKSHIYVRNIQSGVISRLIEEKGELIRGYLWLTNSMLCYWIDKGGEENYKLFTLDLVTKAEVCVTPYDNTSAEVLIKPTEQHPVEMIVLMNKDDPESSEPYLINITNGKTTRRIRQFL